MTILGYSIQFWMVVGTFVGLWGGFAVYLVVYCIPSETGQSLPEWERPMQPQQRMGPMDPKLDALMALPPRMGDGAERRHEAEVLGKIYAFPLGQPRHDVDRAA